MGLAAGPPNSVDGLRDGEVSRGGEALPINAGPPACAFLADAGIVFYIGQYPQGGTVR